MKRVIGKILFGIGIVLIVFQALGIIGNLASGSSLPYPNFSMGINYLMYSLGFCFGFYIFGIVGIILTIVGSKMGGISFNSGRMSRKAAKEAIKNAREQGTIFCPDCGGSVGCNEKFCPKCRRKM